MRHVLKVLAADQFVEIRFADTGSHPEDEFCLATGAQAVQRPLIDIVASTSAVAFLAQSFDADERRDIAQTFHGFCQFGGDKGGIGEELEIAVGMLGQYIKQSSVHQRFTAKDAEKITAL